MDANQSLQELDKDKLIEALVKKLGEKKLKADFKGLYATATKLREKLV